MRPLKPPHPDRRDLAARQRWIQVNGPRSGTHRHLLNTMAWHDNDKGSGCYASIETLAQETALSERTVQYTLADLCAMGWAEPELAPDRVGKHHANKGGRGHTTRYRIIYRDTPTETVQRVRRLSDPRFRDGRRGKGATAAIKGATAAIKGAAVAPDPVGTRLIQGDPKGGKPPSPPDDVGRAVALPPPADAGSVRPLSRAIIATEAMRIGCQMDGANGERWAQLLESICVAYISEVRWTVNQLQMAKRREHPDSGYLPPFHVHQVEAYAATVAADLITYRADRAHLSKGRVA